MNSPAQPHDSGGPVGVVDRPGAGDHDQPYRFGWRPRASAPYPFNTRQYARLLLLRSRVREGLLTDGEDDAAWAVGVGGRPAAA